MSIARSDGEFPPGARIQRDVRAIMRDGTNLSADVYYPGMEGVFPVLLMRTPYDKRLPQTIVYQHPAWYARYGYIVVVQDVRGRYASDGRFTPYFQEAQDGFDTVEWASKLPGSNGRVGMYGFSYAGAAQLLAAGESPSRLRCIAPGFTASDFYDGWTYRGGAFELAFILSWVVQSLAVPDALREGKREVAARLVAAARNLPDLYWTRPLGAFPPLEGAGVAPYFFDWLVHDRRDEYWQQISPAQWYDTIAVPCLHLGGWYDIFVEGTLQNFSALSARTRDDPARAQRLILGPWVHMPWARLSGSRNVGEEGDNSLDRLQLAWFDFWLKDEPNGVLDGPPVRLFVTGENRWRHADGWPPSDVRVEERYLHSSGHANSLSGDGTLSRQVPGEEPADIFVYDPANPVPSLGGRSCCDWTVTPMGAYEQTAVEVRNDVLVFSTPPLDRETEITGTVELVLFAATDAPDTDWTAKLVDVDENGCAFNLCDGIVRARFRESLEHPAAIEPGRVYEYRFQVGSISHLFKCGHRVRIEISSSNFPRYDINPNTGENVSETPLFSAQPATQVVLHNARAPSRLLLPIAPR